MRNFYARSVAAAGLLLTVWQPARAQTGTTQQAAELAWQTRDQWALPGVEAAEMRISAARTEAPGLLYAYPQQLRAGIPVYNQVVTLVFKNGKLAHHAGTFLSVKGFAGQSASPRVSAAQAVAKAVATLPGHPSVSPAAQDSPTGADQQQRFVPAGVARRPIVARLVWAKDKSQQPHLAWNVNVDVLASADWLNIRVDAATGKVLDQDNWTVSEKAASAGAQTTAASVGKSTASTRQKAQALRRPTKAKSILAVTPASYQVVPFPGERPDVTVLTTDTNPWLRAGAGNAATTHGWHFDGTTNYTDTRGNNVWAYDDSLKLNAPGRFATSTGTASSLVFNYVPDFAMKPTLGKNRRAATVNLFYWNNLMHDVMYQYGFNEASANFQVDNLGRGGRGADQVRAEAQDGSGLNNANMSTPPDGTNGRMQMYLWNPATSNSLDVTAPAAIARTYAMAEGGFSTQNLLANKGVTSGTLAYYTDPGTGTHIACTSPSSTSVSGKIALIYRNTCAYTIKVKAAQNEGAIAVVMVNNVPGAPVTMGGTDNSITIPAVMVSQADGAVLAGQLDAGATVQLTLRPPLQLDGDFDSGIIAHEYGHGISNRLTSGGPNTSCLSNAEQAGEGWSDFFALMMTTDWTTAQTTDGPRARPMATYVKGQSATGGGLRAYPYSTNMAVNPLTYANVATNPEVHAIGEIWTATLWDMTWNIIQQQNTIEPNLYNSASTGGNAVALQLVMQGLKLQPCEPGFLDSRDAILAADSLLYGGRYHCAIWGAFARRGMGYSAREGASSSATDQTAAYDLPGVRLSKNSVPMVGSQFAINLTATCECQTQAPVSITDQLPTGLQYVSSTGGTLSGSTVTFPSLSFTAGQQRTFQIVAQTAAGAGCVTSLPVNDDRDANTVGSFTPAVVRSGGGNAWAPTTVRARSGSAWTAGDPNATSDVTLTSAAFTPGAFSVLSFHHFFNSEAEYDGGMVAISVNNGAWQDANTLFLQNGYNSVFATGTASVGKPCFAGKMLDLSGVSAFQQSLIDLSSFSGQSIRVRFQFQSDSGNPYGNALPGWFVDDIQVISGCGGLQQTQLLSSTGAVLGSYARPTFLVPVPAPVITLLSPNNGPVGTSVTITGTNLANATGLTLNGVAIAAGAITANTATSLTFTLPAGASSGQLTVTTLGGTSNGLPFAVTVVPVATTWTGSVSTDWFTAGNWSAGVPNNSLDVTIPTAVPNMPAIATGTASVRSLTLNAGATLVQTGGTLDIGGNLTNNGTFLPSGGTVLLGATAVPNVLGSSRVRFWNLTVQANGLVLNTSAGASVQRVLTLNGNLTTNGNPLTLESNAAGTALVVNNGSNEVVGAVTVQRYISPALNPNAGYRHVSAPISNATVNSLTTGSFTPVVNGAYNTSATPNFVRPFPTVYGYDQSRLASTSNNLNDFDKGWYSPAAASDALVVGQGYTANLAANQTWSFVGALNNGNVSQTLGRNTGPTASASGLHLVGNPYPAPLDWSLVTTTDRPNIGGSVYVFTSTDPSNPYVGNYGFYNAGIGTISPVLPMGQGFFVQVVPGQTSGSLNLKNAHRATNYTNTTFQRSTAETRPMVHLTLHGANLQDDAFVYAEAGAAAGYDAPFDTEKLPNTTGLNLSSTAGGHGLAINGLPAFTSGATVPLSVGVPAAGTYVLRVAELLNLPAGTAAVLVDAQLGTRTDLATLPAAGYAFSVTPAQASALVTGRFFLNLAAAAPLAAANGRPTAVLGLYPNPTEARATTLTGAQAGAKVAVYDAVGRLVLATTATAAGTAQLALPVGAATGVYVVRTGTQAIRLVVE